MHMELVKIFQVKRMTLNVAMYKTIQKTKTLNYDYFTKENIKERNPN